MIKKTVKDQFRKWHEVLSEIIWAYRTKPTGLRVAKQHGLQPKEYSQAMFQELESANDDRIMALENIRLNKAKVAKSYKKKSE